MLSPGQALKELKKRANKSHNFYFKNDTINDELKTVIQVQSQIDKPVEKIIQAAIKYDFDGKTVIFTLPRPNRHHHIYKEFNPLTALSDKNYNETQGFISTNGFVDRVEGLKIATEANQIIKKHPSYNELYSKDMW